MAEQEKVLAGKPDGLSLIPTWQERLSSLKLSSDPHILAVTSAPCSPPQLDEIFLKEETCI